MPGDGAALGDLACVEFGPEAMETLRLWARERQAGEHLPALMLLVARLGHTGVVAAKAFYLTGYRQAIREVQRDLEGQRAGRPVALTAEACRHCRHGFRARGWWWLRWRRWSCVFGLSPQGCPAFELPGTRYLHVWEDA